MTKAEIGAWGKRYAADLDHRVKLAMIRKNGDAKVQEIHELARKNRRGEEGLLLLLLQGRLADARRRARRGEAGIPVALAMEWNRVHAAQTGAISPVDAPFIDVWRRHVAEVESSHGILGIVAPTNGLNGYSWSKMKRAEYGPINSAFDYATWGHEVPGHVLHPCEPSHRRVTTDAKLKRSVCVACELIAWRAAIEAARPTWTRRMHDQLAVSLPTYREYATPAEQREIDLLVSDLGFRQTQLERIRRAS